MNASDQLKEETQKWMEEPAMDGVSEAIVLGEHLLSQLKGLVQADSKARKIAGPLIGRVNGILKKLRSVEAVNWVEFSGGHLAIGHRPGDNLISSLKLQGATHILTLLSDKEGAHEVEQLAKREKLSWLWFPMSSAAAPGFERDGEALDLFDGMTGILKKQGRIYIHCSAGIHRTGMITYSFLRMSELDTDKAIPMLSELRRETGEAVGEQRLAWGEGLLQRRANWSSTPLG